MIVRMTDLIQCVFCHVSTSRFRVTEPNKCVGGGRCVG